MPAHLSVVPHPAAFPTEPLLGNIWHVRLLGSLEARSGDVTLKHFVSHPIAALLARLVLQPQRLHPREELIELLWPGVDLAVGRNRLRNAISSLRRLLEPPGSSPGSVLIADRVGLRVAPGTTRCDALEFERCVRERRYDDARHWYGGELLPGFYEDWVHDERARFAGLFERVEAAPTVARLVGGETSEPVDGGSAPPVAPATAPPAAGQITAARSGRALPGYLTGYFGREDERLRLAEAIAGNRLVTLTGMGGAGKTRLAVEVAREIGGFDVVAFAALADCANAAQSASQLRVALQLPPASDSLDSVVAYLLGARSLLVLDNFEQLVAADGVELVESLLQRLPDLHVLVTSRRSLGLPGEREFSLAALPQPQPGAGLQSVARSPSVAMFVDRARNVRPDFQVTERNHEALAALCVALEGLPLAIELAASRSRAFAPKDMHAALAQRFSLLTRPGTRPRGALLRHDSLRAAIDWSWQLLTPRQQRFLVALSVFRGGWTAASAQAVCDDVEAHALLEQLVADSLLRAELDAGGSMRFGMLEMIRDFLREKIDADAASALRKRHRARYLELAAATTPASAAHDVDTGHHAIDETGDESELPNFNEALRSGVDDGDAAYTLTLALALRAHWERNGTEPEVLASLDRALSAATVHDDLWVNACAMTALLSLSGGKVAAAHRLADAALAHAAPDSMARAAALCARVRISSESLRHGEGLQALLEEAMSIAASADAIDIQAQCLGLMSMLALRQKLGPDKAEALASEARRLYRSIGREREASALLYESTMCLMETGFLPEALAQARAFELESIALADRHRQLKAINQQGVILATMRRWADALESYGRCVQLATQMHNRYWLVFALWNHCRNLARLREPERAARLMAFSERYWTTHFGELDTGDRRFVRQVRALVRRQVGSARLETLFSEGVALSIEQAAELALSSRRNGLASGPRASPAQ